MGAGAGWVHDWFAGASDGFNDQSCCHDELIGIDERGVAVCIDERIGDKTALPNTPQGAEAFARYFMTALNRGYTLPERGAVARLSTSTCKSCAGYEDFFAELVANQRRLDRQPFVFTDVMLVGDTAVGAVYSVDVVVNQQAVRIIDSTGATHQTWTAKTGILVVDLVRTDGHWLVNGVRVRQ